MSFQHTAQFGDALFMERLQIHHFLVAVYGECLVRVIYKSDAAAHASAEIASCLAEYQGAATSHVFTAMVADAFHHSPRAAVAHAETFTC